MFNSIYKVIDERILEVLRTDKDAFDCEKRIEELVYLKEKMFNLEKTLK